MSIGQVAMVDGQDAVAVEGNASGDLGVRLPLQLAVDPNLSSS